MSCSLLSCFLYIIKLSLAFTSLTWMDCFPIYRSNLFWRCFESILHFSWCCVLDFKIEHVFSVVQMFSAILFTPLKKMHFNISASDNYWHCVFNLIEWCSMKTNRNTFATNPDHPAFTVWHWERVSWTFWQMLPFGCAADLFLFEMFI